MKSMSPEFSLPSTRPCPAPRWMNGFLFGGHGDEPLRGLIVWGAGKAAVKLHR